MFELSTYNGSQEPNERTIYILMKGLNAGKPARRPFTNSLAIICQTAEEANRAFTACTALYHSKVYKNYLIGSVIPFLRISDVKMVFNIYEHLFTIEKEAEHKVLHGYLQLSETIKKKQELIGHLITGYARQLLG